MKCSVSIIMPVYNAEDCLERTISSVLDQTFDDFELICIDDCSEDNSLKILKNRSLYDKRVKIISNEYNMGAAYSRNAGLGISNGEYVIFLDSDDYFDSNMLMELYTMAEKNDLDIGLFDYAKKASASNEILYRTRLAASQLADKTFNYLEYDPVDFLEMPVAPWNKLIKRSFLVENKIYFQSLDNSNDVLFSILVLMMGSRIRIVNSDMPLLTYSTESKNKLSNNRRAINEYLVFEGVIREAVKRKFNETQMKNLYFKMTYSFIAQFNNGEGGGIYYTFLRDEGIDNIKRIGGELLEKAAAYYGHILDDFIAYEYKSKWFMDLKVDFFSLLDPLNKIWSIWDLYGSVSVWGVGKYGKRLITAAQKNNKPIRYLYDNKIESVEVSGMEYNVNRFNDTNLGDDPLLVIAMKDIPQEVYNTLADCNVDVLHMMRKNNRFYFEEVRFNKKGI